MSCEWVNIRLGDFIELKRGYDLPKKSRSAGPIPLISSAGVSDQHSEAKVRGPGVVTGRYGTIGDVFYIEEDFWPLNTTLYVRDFKGNDPRFTYYFLKTIDYLQYSDKAAVPGVNRNHLHMAEISVPKSVEEQRRIASVLSCLDDKIEANDTINQTLEQMAQAIFKSWFVDFEPVKAKIAALEAGGSEEDALRAAMQAISGKGEEELTRLQTEQPEQYAELRATAELFPSAMQNSELGEIPEGWELSTIGEEFDVTMGQSPPGDTYNEEGDGVPFFQGRRDFGERFPSNRVYCSSPQRMANAGDTLLSVRAPVGDTNIALMHCCIGRGLAALRHKTGCSSYTYYTIIQLGQALASYDSEGTVFGSINQKNLKALPVVAPAPAVLAAFQQAVAPIDGLIRVNSEETASLADVRDALLPKLLSGELPVSDVEDQPTEVAESANV